MKGIDQIKKELGEAILNSDEYREYQELQKEIDKNPDLKRVIDEYRKRHFALQYDENIEDKFAATQNLSREYEEFNNQVLVRKYLDAEVSFTGILMSPYSSMMSTAKIESKPCSCIVFQ